MSAVVEIKNLTKQYDQKTVVNHISLDIRKGECFGFLGPNGAGKSTTMKMLSCETTITSGELFILGLNSKKNPVEVKRKIGVVPQDDGLDTDFNVIENLLLFGSYYSLPEKIVQQRAYDLLRTMRLDEYSHHSLETLSGGMKRRLSIARGMIHHPEIIFLDEPTTGLDPQARIWIWEFFKKLKEKNSTLILTTHYMEEAERICDRIAIMDHGKILAVGVPKELIQEYIGQEVVELEIRKQDLDYYVNKLNQKKFESHSYGEILSVFVKEPHSSREVLDLIASSNIQIRKATLSDVFLKLAGHQLRDEV